MLDQLAAAAIYKDVQPVLVVTKSDLAAADMLRTAYAGSGIPLVQLNYETGEGLDEVKGYIEGHLCAFCGNSGVGKSTLLNRLTGSTVLSQDKLFATLDPTTRSYRLPGGRGMTITDTVGFIQKLPHGLVDAFKSTLSEVLGADLILKVVDASDEDYERQLEAVDRVLDEIGAGERLTLTVFNKIDLLNSVDRLSFRRRYPEAVLFSAQTGEGLDDLVDRIAREAAATDVLLSSDIPYREGALITLVHEQGTLLHEEYLEDGVRIVAKLPARIAPRLERYRTE